MSAFDAFKFSKTYQVVEVGFTTYHNDVFNDVSDIIIDKYDREIYPPTTVITFEDTPMNRKRVKDCYNRYIRSERYKIAAK